MSEEDINEGTSLTAGTPKPRYAFETSIVRQRRRKVREFQCCVCSLFLCIIVTAIVVSVAFSLNAPLIPTDSNTPDTNFTFYILNQVWPLEDTKLNKVMIDEAEYKDALNAGQEALDERENIEKSTPKLDINSPSYRHQKVVATSCKGRNLAKLGYLEENAAKRLRSKINGSICFNGTLEVFSNICANFEMKCSVFNKYRSYDGTCNNLKEPSNFGVAYKPFRRMLAPDYADGLSAPRISKNKNPLPSARTVSLVVHRPVYKDDPQFTIMLAVFGQFLDHDITATALSQGADGDSISCCADNIIKLHPECFPVRLDANDPYYENYNVTCMEFVRSAPAPKCCFGAREQLNQASAFIDGSVIYGGDKEVVTSLRSFSGGQLKMYTMNNISLLPMSEDPTDGCNSEEESKKGRYCFMTGDARANENLHLTTMHLLWARQHNSIAAKLQTLNPKWSDERLFQETRRIIAAQLQHIAYNEFLPIVLGNFVDSFGLRPLKKGYYKGYNGSIDASIANGFAAFAFRFAHTLIPTLIKMIGNETTDPEYVTLHRMLFNPFGLYENGTVDKTIRGALDTKIQANDPYFTPELKQHMFERPVAVDSVNSTKLCGLDLVSLNIQRGRDHGLPGYTSWREHCALPRPRTFKQLAGDIDDDSLNYIQSIYRDVDDIDPYTGALSERPLENGFLGPTLTCVLLDQFVRLKRGDRFWYENPTRPQAFTERQLQEIRETSLAGIICDNTDEIKTVQARVMERIDRTNPTFRCTEIKKPNFEHWKEDLKRIDVPDNRMNIHVV